MGTRGGAGAQKKGKKVDGETAATLNQRQKSMNRGMGRTGILKQDHRGAQYFAIFIDRCTRNPYPRNISFQVKPMIFLKLPSLQQGRLNKILRFRLRGMEKLPGRWKGGLRERRRGRVLSLV